MEQMNILYIDDKIDLYISRYLSSYSNDKSNYTYSELRFKSEYSYESLLKSEAVQKADILFLDSMLFENRNVGNNKISGEELGFIIKKVFPFKEVIVITQYQEKIEYSVLKKYNSKTYPCSPDSFFKDNWEKEIIKKTENIILNRKIFEAISSKKYIEKYLFESIENSINGLSSYDILTKSDIDNIIYTFENMRKFYE
ncbi:hypothetical protein [Pasteurella canis]|uniref:hypothetical protein n=1 Tax=Pasteurella canis TaxID=753 RepID=UPI00132532FE|nr:hypothetical protein [Pasteurella canis]MXN88469.1 hypothetical protein [Pasteurella canis]